MQSELLGAHAVGVRNLICITGDPPRMGTYPDATAVFDVDSIGLTNIVNQSKPRARYRRQPDRVANSPAHRRRRKSRALNMDEELRRFGWKVDAGAEYVVTQPVFDLESARSILKEDRAIKIPVIAGIWPLTSYRNAEFMVNELRVPVPENIWSGCECRQRRKGSQRRCQIAREM